MDAVIIALLVLNIVLTFFRKPDLSTVLACLNELKSKEDPSSLLPILQEIKDKPKDVIKQELVFPSLPPVVPHLELANHDTINVQK